MCVSPTPPPVAVRRNCPVILKTADGVTLTQLSQALQVSLRTRNFSSYWSLFPGYENDIGKAYYESMFIDRFLRCSGRCATVAISRASSENDLNVANSGGSYRVFHLTISSPHRNLSGFSITPTPYPLHPYVIVCEQ